jgi:hypothetical protein
MPFDNELTVDIPREALVAKLQENRTKHEADYQTALEGFRESVIEDLQEKLELAQDGKDVERYIKHVKPESHLEEYDEAIEMYSMTVQQIITLPQSDFRQLVRDNWNWKQTWTASNTGYMNKAGGSR